MFHLKDLNDNIQCGKLLVKENLPIESRTTNQPSADSQICACHRFTLGSLWKTLKRCIHPFSNQLSFDCVKAKKRSSLGTVSLATYHLIKEMFPGCSFLMFRNLCSKHRSRRWKGSHSWWKLMKITMMI